MIVTAGLASLILFAAVLGLGGYVILAIVDDFVRRSFLGAKVWNHPATGMLFWGAIWLIYALAVAADVQWWWNTRLPSFGDGIDRVDALWFAFISTSTIGLGDFYLQPELIFASDTMKYSVLYLIGFVFLSTFFGKIAETLAHLLPEKHNSLEARLAGTRVLACWPRGFMPWEQTPDKDDINGVDYTANQDLLVSVDDQALVYRIEQAEKLKPDPPVDDENRGLLSTLTGNPIHSMNVELLQQEESLLKDWLDVVQKQKQKAIVQRQQDQLEQAIGQEGVLTANRRDVELCTIPEETGLHQGSGTTDSEAFEVDGGGTDITDTATAAAAVEQTTTSASRSNKKIKPKEEKKEEENNNDDDDRTVLTPADESFNPLARFFGSA